MEGQGRGMAIWRSLSDDFSSQIDAPQQKRAALALKPNLPNLLRMCSSTKNCQPQATCGESRLRLCAQSPGATPCSLPCFVSENRTTSCRGNETIYLHRSGPLLENGLDRPKNRYGRYGFPSFYSISISTVGVDGARVCL